MQSLHARYPFLEGAREAVEDAGVDLDALVQEGGAPVDRGVERVRRALVEGAVAPETRWGTRPELLSYPVARVLVSLLDVPGAVEKYARAEAALAYERFTDDFTDDSRLRSTGEGLSLEALLADFDLGGDVEPAGDGRFSVAVDAYLRLAGPLEGGEWRLAVRALADGRVPVERRELYELLREAVRRRVADGLPLSVPEPVADALADEVAELRGSLVAVERPRVEGVDPERFPPCIRALAERAGDGEAGRTGRFALLAFLGSVGADAEQAAEIVGVAGPEANDRLRYQFERLRGGVTPPSCATMKENGDCIDPDELCETIGHPLAYYAQRLEGGDAAAAEPNANADADAD
jgi:DNA primase large subunit